MIASSAWKERTNMADMTTPPVEFVAAIKSGVPSFSDDDIINTWKEVSKNPNLANVDPRDLAMKIVSSFKTAAQVSPNAAPISVTPPPVLPQNLKNPYVGTSMAARNPDNPQAELMNQFDPEQVKAAYARQNDAYNAGLPARNTSTYFLAGGSKGGEAVTDYQKSRDEQNLLQTTGQQKALQEAATSGISGATATQNQFKTGGDFITSQAKAQQDLNKSYNENVGSGLATQQAQMLNTPGTRQAKMAFLQLKQDADASGRTLPSGMSGDTASVVDMWPYMTGKLQESYKQLLDAAKIKTEVTAAERTENIVRDGRDMAPAQSPYTPARPGQPTAQPANVSQAPTFNFKPGTNMAVVRSVLAKSEPPEVLAAFDKQYPEANKAPVSTADAISNMQKMTAGATPDDIAATKKAMAEGKTPNFSRITDSIAQGRPQPDKHDPEYVLETDPKQLSDIQLLERQALSETDPAKVIALRKNIAQLKGEPYYAKLRMNVGGVNGTNMTMNTEGDNGSTKADVAGVQQQLMHFNNGGKEAAMNAVANASQAGPYPANKVTIGNSDAQKFKVDINKLNADAKALGVIAGGENSDGALMTAIGTAGLAAPNTLARMGGATLSAIGSLLGDGKELTTTSDRKTIEKYAIATQEVAIKKQMLMAQQMAYADQHNGDGTGFISSPEYNAIVKAKPVVNPKTGEVRVPITAEEREKLKSMSGTEKFGDVSIFLGR